MKNIVITGANGLVATEFIKRLLEDSSNVLIYAVTTNIEKLRKNYSSNSRIVCTTLEGLESIEEQVDVVLHCAFARNAAPADVAQSIEYTRKLVEWAKKFCVKRFINISSQGVYGRVNKPLWLEATPVSPDYLYAMGKFATEQLVSAMFSATDTQFTNIRLASVSENARFLNVFTQNAINGLPIKVIGGKQMYSFVSVKDVADALLKVVNFEYRYDNIYNLGVGDNYSLREIAEVVCSVAKEKLNKSVELIIEPSDNTDEIGMDNNLFCRTFEWTPQYDLRKVVERLYCHNGIEIKD